MQRTADVKTYFTDRARLFDALYKEDSRVLRSFNRVFRRAMFLRYVHTMSALGALDGRRILDVGCGSGRYAIELAQQGAHVVGVDFSDEMLKMARTRAEAAGVGDRVRFFAEDFSTWAVATHERFDASFAMGVLDYVEDAAGFVRLMAGVSDAVIASFPSPSLVRMPLRKLRYRLRNCPTYFYWRHEIESVYSTAGLTNLDVRRLGLAGYWVHGKR